MQEEDTEEEQLRTEEWKTDITSDMTIIFIKQLQRMELGEQL